MTKRGLLAAVTALWLLLTQACNNTADQQSFSALESLQSQWSLLHSEIIALDDSIHDIGNFCSRSDKKLKKDAQAFAASQERLAALSAAFVEDKEKITEITLAFEDFEQEWKRLSKELDALQVQVKKGKAEKNQLARELEFFHNSLLDATTIVSSLRAALEETAISARDNFASYEKDIVLLK